MHADDPARTRSDAVASRPGVRAVVVAAALVLAGPALASEVAPPDPLPMDNPREQARDWFGRATAHTGLTVGIVGMGIAAFGGYAVHRSFQLDDPQSDLLWFVTGLAATEIGVLAMTVGGIAHALGNLVSTRSLAKRGATVRHDLPMISLGLAIAGGVIGAASPILGVFGDGEGFYVGLGLAGGCVIASFGVGVANLVTNRRARRIGDGSGIAWAVVPELRPDGAGLVVAGRF